MDITITCPVCGESYTKDSSLAGKRGRCKICNHVFVIPAPSAADGLRMPGSGTGAYQVAEAAPPSPSPEGPASDPASPSLSPSPRRERPKTSPPPSFSPQAARQIVAYSVGGAAVLAALAVGLSLAFRAGNPAPAGDGAKTKPASIAEAKRKDSRPRLKAPESRPASPPRLSTAELVARCEPSVALIQGKHGSGTGFLVRPGILATNAHVINGEIVEDIEVRFPSAEESRQGPLSARLLYQDKLRDLAFLEVETDLPALSVAQGYTFRKGEDVTVIGNPGIGGTMVLENAVSRGVVSSRVKLNGRDYLQLGISINPGNSGGPVFDSTGSVIGVVTLKTTKQEGLAFCVPAEDLGKAVLVAESRGGPDNGDGGDALLASNTGTSRPVSSRPAIPAGGPAPELAYGWEPGKTYVYAVDFSLKAGSEVVSLQGASIYRVKSAGEQGTTLSHRGWLVTRKRGADGRAVPGSVSGPETKSVELTLDRKGAVVDAKGASPLPLVGDLSMLMVEPLPERPQPSWEDSQSITLSEIQKLPGTRAGTPSLGRPALGGHLSLRDRLSSHSRLRSRLSSRSRLRSRFARPSPTQPAPPQVKVTAHPADEQTRYSLGPLEGSSVSISKVYEMTTEEIVGEEPRMKMTGEGTIRFDVKAGLPTALDYRLQVVENSENVTVRIPVQVHCRLLSGAEKERALRPPVMPPTALNPIDNQEIGRAVIDLKSGDINRARSACRLLADADPVDDRRGDVARVLERLLKSQDAGLRGDAVRALGLWGDAQTTEMLVQCLNNESFGVRDQLFEALGRLGPTESAAEAVAGWLAKDANRAGRTLRALGPVAERPVLRVLSDDSDPRTRSEACRVLRDVGGKESIETLQALAGLRASADLGRVATESIKAIQRRHPDDNEWASILLDTKSPDGGRRRGAVERILAIAPDDAHRDDVAKALEKRIGDSDWGVQSAAIRALALWGEPSSRAVLLERFADPGFRPNREIVETLSKLGPADSHMAEVIAGRMKSDRGLVLETLTRMGSVAEKATIGLLSNEKDWGVRNDLCKLLGNIGTKASLPVLQQVARGDDNGLVKHTAQMAAQQVEFRNSGGLAVSAAVADLKSPEHNRCKQAVERLSSMPVDPARRAEVARALDALLDDKDIFLWKPLMKAEAVWGDGQTADALAARLEDPDLRDWREALQALFALRPDARSAELAVRRLREDSRLVLPLLRPQAHVAEAALLDLVKSEPDAQKRIDACRALGEVGTPAVIAQLQALAGKAGDGQLARDAGDALKAIQSRL